jgi:hypothetical protein
MGAATEFLGGMAGAGVGTVAPTVGQIVKSGALYGGLSGFGEGDGAGDSMARAATGAGTNALLGYGLAKAAPAVGNMLAKRGSNALAPDMAVVEAGQRQGIPVRTADAIPSAANRTAAAEASPYGGPIIKRAMQADSEAMNQGVRNLGDGGAAKPNYALGQTVQGVGERYIARTRQQADRLYTKARDLAGNATVTPRNADAVIDQHIQELSSAPTSTEA